MAEGVRDEVKILKKSFGVLYKKCWLEASNRHFLFFLLGGSE